MGETQKMLVIGIDGATFKVIDPMVERGELPNLAMLMREGCRSDLQSTYPPITHVAWSTFSTGKNPGKHGIFDFIEPPYHNSENTPFAFTNLNAIKCATFWQILQGTGLKIGIINLPMTYPPPPLNGFLIGGIDTPNENVIFTYPENLITQLRERGIYYRPDYGEFKKGRTEHRDLEEVRRDYLEIEEERGKAILWLMEEKEWDLLVVVLSLPDRLQHHFWHFHEPDNPREPNPFTGVVEEAYRRVDQIIGDMLNRINGDVPIMVMSDHGFRTYEKVFFINHWLWKKGFLALKKIHILNFWKYYRVIKITRPLRVILNATGLRFLAKALPSSITKKRLTVLIPFPKGSPNRVDWKNTLAYGAASGIYINLKGRTPNGVVSPGNDYESIRNRIIDELKTATDPRTGEQLAQVITKTEEAFTGPSLSDGPDIFFGSKGQNYVVSTNFYFQKSFKEKRFGTHDMEGILILHGPPFKRNHHLRAAHIQDCMPTIFYLLGVPIPSDFDGKIIDEAFLDEHLVLHRPEFGAPIPFEAGSEARKGASTYTSEQAEMIRERLKSLGYID